MEAIEIALASDGNYFPGLLVTAVSLAQHASREVVLTFNVLDGGIGDEKLLFLRKKIQEAHPRSSFRIFPVDEARFSDFPEWTGGSRMTYARLLMAELLTDLDFVLYCDVDFLWTADVAELWTMRDVNHVLQACADGWVGTLEKESAWFAERGLKFVPSRYICAGLLLVNLGLWRQGGYGRKTMDFLHEHTDVLFVDQSAINAVVDNYALLPRKWGRFSREITAKELPGSWAIHFAGGAPWCSNWWTSLMTPADFFWYRCYADLIGCSARMARRSFISDREFFKRRLAYVLVHTPCIRTLFFCFLWLVGRGLYIPSLVGRRI